MCTNRRQFLTASAALAAAPLLSCRRAAPQGRLLADLWFTYGGRNREVLERLVARFNRAQSHHFIRAVYQGDYFEGLAKLRTALAVGAAPALSHVIGEVVPYLAEAGTLEPLSNYDGADELDIVPALGQSGSWVRGSDRPLVALPFNRSTPIAYTNADLFGRLGLRPPRTWGELRSVALECTSRRGRETVRHGFGCPISWWFWVALVGQAGGKIIEDDGRPNLGGSSGIEALELLQKLVHEDRTMKPPPGRDYNAWEQTNQDFLAGRTAMIWTSTAFLKYIQDNASFSVQTAPLPRFRRAAVPTGGTHWIMIAQAPRAAKLSAWEFLRFMHASEQAADWAAETGYLPVTHGAVRRLESRGYYRANPNNRVAIEQLRDAVPWPWASELFRIQREIVQPRLEQAVLLRSDARTVLSAARKLATQAMRH